MEHERRRRKADGDDHTDTQRARLPDREPDEPGENERRHAELHDVEPAADASARSSSDGLTWRMSRSGTIENSTDDEQTDTESLQHRWRRQRVVDDDARRRGGGQRRRNGGDGERRQQRRRTRCPPGPT